MGADFHATVIVGVKVPSVELYEQKRVKAFAHNHPEDWEVDPKSGKKLWTEEETFLLEGVVVDDYDWREDRKAKKNAKAAIVHEDGGDGDRGDHAFIGRHLVNMHIGEGDEQVKALKGVDMLAEKKFLEELLTPHRLWNEREFGIWLVGDVS